ncbi:hypothetical protein Rhopal_005289-T1 [Rhodotorula paludigena]|uniref:CID domain-containing protein n=1 Tax=Rhodotorula paludigena TaxID=86838 RepID=A0AAV5GP57_9BASI|nr:hypothetical protein Rhopal_005289-T1 [Rhodotorula paludigena]
MDPFEVRVQFVTLASRLGSSVASISKVAAFALKHAAKCADDIWDCYLDEVAAANLNSRVNLLYLLDALLDKEGPRAAHNAPTSTKGVHTSYRELVERDLANVVRLVVPDSREGVLNWMATSQVLRSWKTRRLLDADILDQVSTELEDRKAALHADSSDSSTFANFSRNDILRRIEDDRERHKRLKERLWVLPVPSTLFSLPLAASLPASSSASQKPSPISPASPFDPSSRPNSAAHHRRPSTANGGTGAADKPATAAAPASRGPELALEIEFEQLWEASADERRAALGPEADAAGETDPARPWKRPRVWALDEQDREDMRSERRRCFDMDEPAAVA